MRKIYLAAALVAAAVTVAPAPSLARDIIFSRQTIVEGEPYDVHVYDDGSALILEPCTSLFFCLDTMNLKKKQSMKEAVRKVTSCEIGDDATDGASLRVLLKCTFAERAVLGITGDNGLCDQDCERAHNDRGVTQLPSPSAELERLEALLDRGAITREEFEAAKRKFLGLD